MAWTVDSFKAAMPVFENAETYVVQNCLDEAVGEVNTSVFGDKADVAVKWLTARLLALQGYGGESARLKHDQSKTIYDARYKEIRGQVAYGLRVI